ncbi:hypothetical protein [Caproiciproducens faecalis]|uniref:hypothetical protein n=1 Tax=Caproiciproducens faecalis TaxID=2820301 RepID=UPI002104262A|nr:hypothetical protein [Caproiciproducens faecalis]
MFAFVIFNGDFDLPQYLFACFADCRAEGGDGIGRVEVEDAQKILMLKVFVGFQPAAGQNRVGDADRGGASELCSDVELIIFLQKATVNDVKNVVLMLLPIFVCQLSGNLLQLVGKTFFAGNGILPFQRCRNRVLMFRAILPKIRTAGILTVSCVGNIKDVPDSRLVTGCVDERNPFSSAPDIPAHFFVPDFITGAGRSVGALGIDHELLMVRVFVEPRGGFQKIRPAFVTGGDLRRRAVGHLCQSLHITRHNKKSSFRSFG